MGLLKNDVGRPSNKTIMVRRILKLSTLVLIIGFFGITLYFFGSGTAEKLKGAAASAIKDETLKDCVFEAYIKENPDEYDRFENNDIFTNDIDTLTEKQLKSIKKLVCNSSVSSAAGIEKLTGLEELSLYGIGGKKLNLNLSKNVKLKKLKLHKAGLTTINLTKNVNLTTLDIYEVNLKSLDLNKNVNLKTLSLPNTNLTSIDLSKNTKLIKLNLGNKVVDGFETSKYKNNFNVINLKDYKNLKSLILTDLNLTDIDLSKNTKLTTLDLSYNNIKNMNLYNQLNLEILNLSDNDLENIDLSKNTKLTNLNLADNKLETLDLSKNTKLTNLNLADNELEILNLSANLKLTELNISNLKLNDINLSKNEYLKELDIENISRLKLDELNKKVLGLKNIQSSVVKLSMRNESESLELDKFKKLEKLSLNTHNLKTLDLTQNIKLKELKIINSSNLENIIVTNGNDIKFDIDSRYINPKITVKKLNISCPSSVKAKEEFECKTNVSGATIRISKTNLAKGYSEKVNTKSDSKKIKAKYTNTGYAYVKVSKAGYKSVQKKVQILNSKDIVLNCPETVNVNTWFKCITNLEGVKISASSVGFSGNTLSFTTTAKDKTKDLRYSKTGTITVTASKSGYVTTKKTVKVQDILILSCPSSAKVGQAVKCNTNKTGVTITLSGANSLASGYSSKFTTISSDLTKDIKYTSALFTNYKSIIKKDSSGKEYINAKVTASKSGYKSVIKYIRIYR